MAAKYNVCHTHSSMVVTIIVRWYDLAKEFEFEFEIPYDYLNKKSYGDELAVARKDFILSVYVVGTLRMFH